MTNEQRKTILEYLKVSSKDGKWHIKVADNENEWLVTSDLIPVDCATGDCAEHNKRLVDPWLMDQLANKLAKKVSKRERLDSKPVTKKEKLERHLNRKQDINKENNDRLKACEAIFTKFNFECRMSMLNKYFYCFTLNGMEYAISNRSGAVVAKSVNSMKLIEGIETEVQYEPYYPIFTHRIINKEEVKLPTDEDIQAIDDYFEKTSNELWNSFKNDPKAFAVHAGGWS